MAKRIAEIAEEVGVRAQDIIRECEVEGIPLAIVKNGMSTVSAGLEAAIRAWLSGPSDGQSGFVASNKCRKQVGAVFMPFAGMGAGKPTPTAGAVSYK